MDNFQKPQQAGHHQKPSQNFVRNNFKPSIASKVLVVSLILVSLALTASLASVAFSSIKTDNLIQSDRYQAVFLQDGQVYIGHMSGLDDEYIRLDDVFYVLPPQNLATEETVGADGQTQQQTASQPVLAKRGKEIHAPEGTIYIKADKVLFWENMKNEGEVAKTIERYYQLEASGELESTLRNQNQNQNQSQEQNTTE